MSVQHFVRVGVLGSVGRFDAVGRQRYRRGVRVICRTSRGIEVGQVLAATEPAVANESNGTLLRRVSVQDELLIARLEKNREEAFRACSSRLSELGSAAILLDVEHLFDGQSLCFYFLGDGGQELNDLTSELAEAYEAKAQLQRFAETLAAGCGPNCGTEEGAGCGSRGGGCTSCGVVGVCGTRPKSN